ncbi:MAG TPA: AAA domain-containing protein, partial [Spongiibacteraceae bacterium]|nr:AAA domain-containing protein [Spongiibacteraceae bacterium]
MAGDYQRITDLRKINARLLELSSLGAATDSVWKDYSSDLAAIETALKLQSALRSSLNDQGWQIDGMSLVDSGECGGVAQSDLKHLREMLHIETELHKLKPFTEKTGGLWSGLSSNTSELQEAIKFYTSLTAVLTKIATTTDLLVAVRAPIERLLGEGNLLLEPTGAIAASGQAYISGWTNYQNTFAEFAKIALHNAEREAEHDDMAPDELAEVCRNIIGSAPKLKNWCAWNKARSAAVAAGLQSLAEGIEKESVPLLSVRKIFDVNYCRWWLNAVVDQDEVLLNFVSAEHEKRIRDFKELDEYFTTLTRSWVRAQLCAELPSQDSVSRNSEWGLLRYEMQKKSKHLPLRDLMGRSPTAITTLTPCLLMSPLSVAQYLSPEVTNFDIVIFDEASQIPVWDAVGAIARAKQVVMVGDPKQLPPTSFFDRAETDSEDTDIEADLESILDECIGANLPTLNLSWHYRSRHESLIAFSNYRYYEGRLVTFPSPYTEDRAVSFHHIAEGTYEKGGARTNKPEAMALVSDLVAKLKSPECQAAGLTVGVVTFNAEQQRLIEDLLDDARRSDPTLERFFADTELEPVFVKNLESVQGDERDIMYFSLTYGPTVSRSVSMNFGPLNKQGGERRLNVAITRARQELRVFSSLRAEQLDLSRTQAEGVRDLKHFMEFAERGSRALGEAVFGSVGDFESPFEEAVARALVNKGWRLQSQIGVSAFRVDLGVVDPDAPGSYLAGIECDGATYHRSATARDRDMIREQMLRDLGWNILRIWSTDWWVDADTVVEKIHNQLNDLLEQRRATRALQSNVVPMHSKQTEKVAAPVSVLALDAEDTSPLPQALYAKAELAGVPQSSDVYVETDFTQADFSVNPEAFFDRHYDPVLILMIERIV